MNKDCIIRSAIKNDIGTILTFIRELAEYEKLAHEVITDEQTLERNLFGPHPFAECLIAEIDHQPVGFALFFHNFSTFLGKPGLYVEDIYVSPEYRSHGVGSKFFKELARIALERDCGRMEWWVLDWNEAAIKFYKRLSAEPMGDWTVQRLARNGIEKLANKNLGSLEA